MTTNFDIHVQDSVKRQSARLYGKRRARPGPLIPADAEDRVAPKSSHNTAYQKGNWAGKEHLPTKPITQKEKELVDVVDKEFPTVISKNVSNTDPVSFQHFIECVIVDYQKRTDVAFSGETIYYAYYFWFMLFMHHKRIGALTGTMANNLPDQVEGTNYAVPFPIAKYLEYLSPFQSKTKISPALNVPADFFGTPVIGESGIIPTTAVFPRGPTIPSNMLPDWMLLNGAPDQYQSDGGTGYTRVAGDVFFGYQSNGTTPLAFLAWLAGTGNVQKYSALVEKRGKTMSLADVPTKSPNLSAHSRANVTPGATRTSYMGGVSAPTNYFEPELTQMFSINLDDSGQFSNTTLKSSCTPKFMLLGYEFPYTQIAFVFIWLCNRMEKYQAGSVYSIRVEGRKRLKSLYPQPHFVDGYALSKVVAREYQQIMANKSNDTGANLDPSLYNFTVFYAVCLYALQRRLNECEVLHMNDLRLDVTVDGNPYQFIVPQFTYADNQWSTISLPVQITQLVEALGPIIVRGHLRVPVVNYQTKPTARDTAGSMLGPMNWSAWGYTGNEMQYFGCANLYTTGIIRTNGTQSVFPDVRIADANDLDYADSSVVQQAALQYFYGQVAIYPGAPSAPATQINAIYPMILNGTAAAYIINTYRNFIGLNQSVNVIPLAAPSHHTLGSAVPMLTSIIYDQFTGVKQPISNVGYLPSEALPTPSDNGQPTLVDADPCTFSNDCHATNQDIVHGLSSVGQEQESSQNPNDITFVCKLHQTIIGKLKPNPSDQPIDPDIMIAPYTCDPPLSGGTSAIHNAMAAKLSVPNSRFADEMSKRDMNSSSKGTPPISFLMNKYTSNIANQAMMGLPTVNDAHSYFESRIGITSNDVQTAKKGEKHHPIASIIGKTYKMGTGLTTDIFKGEKGIVKLLGKDL